MVLIYEQKVAILWNGAWHYKFCGGKHSLAQVQSRDKIKSKMIEKDSWSSYIIKDMGKHDIKKVIFEFEIFKKFLIESFVLDFQI